MVFPMHKRGLYYTNKQNKTLKCPERVYNICQGFHEGEHSFEGLVWVTDSTELAHLQSQDPECPRAADRVFKVASVEGLMKCFPTLSDDHPLDSFHRSLSGWGFRMVRNIQNKTMIYWYHSDSRFHMDCAEEDIHCLTQDMTQFRKNKRNGKSCKPEAEEEVNSNGSAEKCSSETNKDSSETCADAPENIVALLQEVLAKQREILQQGQTFYTDSSAQRATLQTSIFNKLDTMKCAASPEREPLSLRKELSRALGGLTTGEWTDIPNAISQRARSTESLFFAGLESGDLSPLEMIENIDPDLSELANVQNQKAIEESILDNFVNVTDQSHCEEDMCPEDLEEPSITNVQVDKVSDDLNDLVDRAGVGSLVRRLLEMNRKAVEDAFYSYDGKEEFTRRRTCTEMMGSDRVEFNFRPRDVESDLWSRPAKRARIN